MTIYIRFYILGYTRVVQVLYLA